MGVFVRDIDRTSRIGLRHVGATQLDADARGALEILLPAICSLAFNLAGTSNGFDHPIRREDRLMERIVWRSIPPRFGVRSRIARRVDRRCIDDDARRSFSTRHE